MKNEALKQVKQAYITEYECIKEMLNYFDDEVFSKAVELLKNACRIGAVGCGHSGIICQHFTHLMCCIDIARAIYESAARLLKHNLSECEALGLSGNRVALVGGITNSNVCVKVVSEILEKETVVINGASAGAAGAAMLAAIGIDIYSDEVEAFDSMNFKTVKL